MQKEKIALIALVVIVVAALSIFVTAVNTNIFENLFKEKLTISEGDCADVNYIGRYTSNNTIFDTSYTYPQNKSGGTPIKIFVSFDANATSPKAGYTKDMIKGFMNGLIGLSEGQTKIIGPIPPEDAYGAKKLTVGAIFTTQYLAFGMNQTVEVTNYTSENLSVKWIQMENSTSIINITDTNVTVRATPTKSTNLSDVTKPILYGEKYLFIFPNATTASWNNTTITVVCSPVIGQNYTFQGQGSIGMINYTVSINNITGDTINITITNEENPELSYLDLYRTLTFNRTFVLPRLYTDIPSMYVSYFYTQDIEKAGYSLNPLAGESLTFEVVVEKVYKTSQGTS